MTLFQKLLKVLCISLLLLWLVYPDLVKMRQTPMGSTSWSLQDPTVSFLNFIPGRQVWRYELFENHNGLWSNLKAFGAPPLANDIQSAPLYPLTWLLLWMPEKYFSHAFILLSLLLLSAGTYAFARKVWQWTSLAAWTFSFVLTYAVGATRWLNHPWHNGWVAGVLYLCSLLWVLQSQRWSLKGYIAVGISAFSLITCGFPESSLAMASLVMLLHLPLYAHLLWNQHWSASQWKHYFFGLLGIHWVAFAFASPQLFALFEFVGQVNLSNRADHGLAQFSSIGILAQSISPWLVPPGQLEFKHYVGWMPLGLMVLGISHWLKNIRYVSLALSSHPSPPWELAHLWVLLVYLLKVLPIWPAYNAFIGSLPIFNSSWFIHYFNGLLFWCVAYWAAKGMQTLAEFFQQRQQQSTMPKVVPKIWMSLGLLIFVLMGWEQVSIRDRNFYSWKSFNKHVVGTSPSDQEIVNLLTQQGWTLPNVRYWNKSGLYAHVGLATFDNGAPALIPKRLQQLRVGLFESLWNKGLMPATALKHPEALRWTSTQILSTETLERFQLSAEGLLPLGNFKNTHGVEQVLYHDPKALARAYIPSQCSWVKHSDEALQQMLSQNSSNLGTVFLEGTSQALKDTCSEYQGAYQSVSIQTDKGHRVTLEAVQGPSIVVLHDLYYPGWKAVDTQTQQSLDIHVANVAFRAVLLPEHRQYQLSFVYEPQWQSYSVLWIISAVLLALIWVLRRRF